MKCPLCGSTDVECSETTAHHVHICNACGHRDIFRSKPLTVHFGGSLSSEERPMASDPKGLGESVRLSPIAMGRDDRLAALFACVGLLLDDGGLYAASIDTDLQSVLLNVMLDIGPEFVPPYCLEPEDWQAWRDLIDKHAPGVRTEDGGPDDQ